MRRLTLLLILIIISSVGIAMGISINRRAGAAAAVDTAQQLTRALDNSVTSIDGAEHPEMISDHIAYSVIFRMIADRHTDDEVRNIRAYIRQMVGLGKQKNCQGCRQTTGDGDADIDALIAAAEEFHQRVSVLDRQAEEIKDRTWPNPSPQTMAELTRLQTEQEALATEIAASLPGRLSVGGFARVRDHINGYVKQNIKLTRTQATPPGREGWQYTPDHQH
jgi:hypothetical protein